MANEQQQPSQLEKWAAGLVLFAALVLGATLPAYLLSVRIARVVSDMDHRVGIHDVGLIDLSRQYDSLLARLEDVNQAVRQQAVLTQTLAAKVVPCPTEPVK